MRSASVHGRKNEMAKDRTDWAEDRTALANERTFAGWMRSVMAAVAIAMGPKADLDCQGHIKPFHRLGLLHFLFCPPASLCHLCAVGSARCDAQVGHVDDRHGCDLCCGVHHDGRAFVAFVRRGPRSTGHTPGKNCALPHQSLAFHAFSRHNGWIDRIRMNETRRGRSKAGGEY